jgi:hypothetical protein
VDKIFEIWYIFYLGAKPNARVSMSNDSVISVDVLNCNCSADKSIKSPKLTPNQWYHVAITYHLNAGEMKFYLNGSVIGVVKESMYSYYSTNSSTSFLGSYAFSNHYFNGSLDEAILWNRALTECEIKALYQSNNLVANNYSIQNKVKLIKSCGADSITVKGIAKMKSYSWSNGSTKSSIVIKKSGTYNLKVTDSTNCVFYDTFYISLLNPKISPRDTVVCSNDSILLTIKNNFDYNSSTTNWSTAIKKIPLMVMLMM